MFKSQGGKFSSVFEISKDKRNQGTPLHTYLTAYHGTFCQEENQLMVAAQNNFQSNY